MLMTAPRIDVIVYTCDMANTQNTEIRELLEDAGYDVGYVSVRNVNHYADEYAEMVTDR
jgi:hypothetical protein